MDMHMPAGRIDPGASPGLEDSVRAEQLALLTTNRADQYVNILTAGIVVAIVRNLYPAWLLALWLFLCIAVVLARSLVVDRYKARPAAQRRFGQIIIAGTIAIGALWGLAASAILLTNNPDTQFFLMIMLGGMMAGGVMGNAASLPAMYGFALPIILPSVLAFATRGTDMHLLGLLQTLYAGIVLNAGRKFNLVITDNIRLRLAQGGILGRLSASESAMAEAQKLAQAGSWDVDLKTNTIAMSQEAHRIFAIVPSNLPTSFHTMLSRVHPDDRAAVNAHIAASRQLTATTSVEYRLVMPSGAIKHVVATPRTIFDSAGQAIRIIGSVQDITASRAAEQKLHFANLLLQTQMEASPDGVLVIDGARRIAAFNHRFAAMWRIPLAELESGDDDLILARIMAQVKNPEAYAARAEYLLNHPELIGDDEIETLDNRIIERHSVALQPTAGGASLGRVRFFRDISLRRAAQKTQELAYLLLRTQMEASPDGILVVDANRQITAFNQRFAEIWRIPAAEMRIGNDTAIRARMRLQVRDTSAYAARLEKLYESPDTVASDEVETTDNRIIERFGNALVSASGERLGHIRFFRDISLRRAAEKKLQLANLLLKTQMEASPDGILVVDPDLQVIAVNRRLADIWQIPVSELQNNDYGKAPENIISVMKHPAAFQARIDHLYANQNEIGDDEIETADGRITQRHSVPLHSEAGVYLGRAWFFADVTAIRQAAGAMAYRDRLLHAVTAATSVAVKAPSLAAGVPEALRQIGQIMTVDRILVMQNMPGEIPPLLLHYLWEAPYVTVPFSLGTAPPLDQAEMAAWRAPLNSGAPVFADILTAQGAPRQMLEHYQVQSMCLVPVYVASDVWGFICVDESRTVRRWIASEIETLGILADIAGALVTRERTRVALEASEDLFRRLTTTANDAVILSGPTGEILQWNPAAERIFGYTAAEVIGRQTLPLIVLPQDRARVSQAIAAAGPDLALTVEFTLMRKDGSGIATEMSVSAMPLPAGQGILNVLRDITARKTAEALALRHARFDDLTGLANRAVFVEAVQSAIAHANRGGPGFAVLFIDLDHFKDVNDTLGHPAGDALLTEVAARLTATIRETDTAGRFGGDEFAIAATEIRDPTDAALLAEKLLADLSAPYIIGGNTIHIEASIGVDIFSPKSADPETLLSHADVALYRAKAEGRGMYRFFTPLMDRDVHNRVSLAAELREAIAAGQLFLLYQPQVAAATGRITGLEALIRWNHPQRGVLVPANFIPVAEATGLIGAVGHYVLWEACRQAQEWITAGLPPTRVSINVSALQFKTAMALEADIAAALAATGLPPHLLELELTETVLMGASRDHNDTLRRLRERGIKLSIDDFGTGYSSLDYLRRYPVDHIKIAQSFIKHVETEPGDASIVRAIIGLARTLRIKLIVEGVATRSQLDLLQSWGATEVQGFYFARPLPPETIFLLLKSGTITPP